MEKELEKRLYDLSHYTDNKCVSPLMFEYEILTGYNIKPSCIVDYLENKYNVLGHRTDRP